MPRLEPAGISIHAPHTGRDAPSPQRKQRKNYYFNPRAPYGARHFGDSSKNCEKDISIHAPHTGRDNTFEGWLVKGFWDFNPRAPYGARPAYFDKRAISTRRYFNPRAPYGARLGRSRWYRYWAGFQSTRPIRGATLIQQRCFRNHPYFNPRAPYGARPDQRFHFLIALFISIHAPHTGRDVVKAAHSVAFFDISIHAPHTGRDLLAGYGHNLRRYFNPRAPYGARP